MIVRFGLKKLSYSVLLILGYAAGEFSLRSTEIASAAYIEMLDSLFLAGPHGVDD